MATGTPPISRASPLPKGVTSSTVTSRVPMATPCDGSTCVPSSA